MKMNQNSSIINEPGKRNLSTIENDNELDNSDILKSLTKKKTQNYFLTSSSIGILSHLYIYYLNLLRI